MLKVTTCLNETRRASAGLDEQTVHPDRRRACGQTDDEGMLAGGCRFIDHVYDVIGCPSGQPLII
jgi:hypothetical protein